MLATMEEMKNEAIKRMEKLGLMKECIDAFKEGKVWSSQEQGALYELNEERMEIVRQFENGHDVPYLVYHVIISHAEFGTCFNMLFVSPYKDEWEMDDEDIHNNTPLVMCKNLDDPFCDDMGSIGVRAVNGGLVRTM